MPLFFLVVVAAILVWLLLIVSIVGAVYAVFIGVFLFFSHAAFLAYVRGSAVRLGPDQFPDLHARVQDLASQAGIRKVPEAYLLQAGGALNAFATKFLRSKIIVLYSDLLEACGENSHARDMIIGHELGHIRAGHLNGMWFLVPGFFIPFLGAACSRAREYTCDRYGLALSGDKGGALTGLAILAAGGDYGHRVNLQALARQKNELNTGWMTIGKWLKGHPPLCDRVAALEPQLATGLGNLSQGPIRASLLIALLIAAWLGALVWFAVKGLPLWRKSLENAKTHPVAAGGAPAPAPTVADVSAARQTVEKDIAALAKLAEEFRGTSGKYPADVEALYGFWRTSRAGSPEPTDPFTGYWYDYEPNGDQFVVWSNGPDGQVGTFDDIQVFGGAKS
jgi:Zn-dependent protease with chaperone function